MGKKNRRVAKDKVQAVNSQIDDIKQKLTSQEYQDIVKTLGEIYVEKDDSFKNMFIVDFMEFDIDRDAMGDGRPEEGLRVQHKVTTETRRSLMYLNDDCDSHCSHGEPYDFNTVTGFDEMKEDAKYKPLRVWKNTGKFCLGTKHQGCGQAVVMEIGGEDSMFDVKVTDDNIRRVGDNIAVSAAEHSGKTMNCEITMAVARYRLLDIKSYQGGSIDEY